MGGKVRSRKSPQATRAVLAAGCQTTLTAVRRARGEGQGTACLCFRSTLAPDSSSQTGEQLTEACLSSRDDNYYSLTITAGQTLHSYHLIYLSRQHCTGGLKEALPALSYGRGR